jgi:hypothetical protein
MATLWWIRNMLKSESPLVASDVVTLGPWRASAVSATDVCLRGWVVSVIGWELPAYRRVRDGR